MKKRLVWTNIVSLISKRLRSLAIDGIISPIILFWQVLDEIGVDITSQVGIIDLTSLDFIVSWCWIHCPFEADYEHT